MTLVELGEDEFVASFAEVQEHERQVAEVFAQRQQRITELEEAVSAAAASLRAATAPGPGRGWALVRLVAADLEKLVS